MVEKERMRWGGERIWKREIMWGGRFGESAISQVHESSYYASRSGSVASTT